MTITNNYMYSCFIIRSFGMSTLEHMYLYNPAVNEMYQCLLFRNKNSTVQSSRFQAKNQMFLMNSVVINLPLHRTPA